MAFNNPTSRPPLPTFLIIGAQKSATRWLRYNLGLHPDIYTPDVEISFFSHRTRYVRFGLDWYLDQFAGWQGEPYVGEATPGYMMHRHHPDVVAKRIRQTVPDVKLIAVLRNPIDRAQSAMLHHVKHGRIPPGTKLVDVVRDQRPGHEWMGLVSGGWYGNSLKPFFNTFGDQLLVLLHDDVSTDPAAVYKLALEHVGADASFVPDSIDEVVFSNTDRAKQPHPLSEEDRVELWEYFARDVRALERMLGRDLSAWAPQGLDDAMLSKRASTKLKQGLIGRFDETIQWVAPRLDQASQSGNGAAAEQIINRLAYFTYVLARGVPHPRIASDEDEPAEERGQIERYRSAADDLRAMIVAPGVVDQVIGTPLGMVDAALFVRLVLIDQVALGLALVDPAVEPPRIPVAIAQMAHTLATRLEEKQGLCLRESEDATGALIRFLDGVLADPSRGKAV